MKENDKERVNDFQPIVNHHTVVGYRVCNSS